MFLIKKRLIAFMSIFNTFKKILKNFKLFPGFIVMVTWTLKNLHASPSIQTRFSVSINEVDNSKT